LSISRENEIEGIDVVQSGNVAAGSGAEDETMTECDGKEAEAAIPQPVAELLSSWPAVLARALLLSPEPEASGFLPASRSQDIRSERRALASSVKKMEQKRREMKKRAIEAVETALCALSWRRGDGVLRWAVLENGYEEREKAALARVEETPLKPGPSVPGDEILERAAVLSVKRTVLGEGKILSAEGCGHLSELSLSNASEYGETASPMRRLLSLSYSALGGSVSFEESEIEKLLHETRIFGDVVSSFRGGKGPGAVFRLLAFARRISLLVEDGRWPKETPVPRILPDNNVFPEERHLVFCGQSMRGKTRMVKEAAEMCGLPLLHVEGNDIPFIRKENVGIRMMETPSMILVDGVFECGNSETACVVSRRLVDFREISPGVSVHPLSMIVFESRVSPSLVSGREASRLASRLEEVRC